ncbi:MAG TPA: DUF6082 family protein [Streptosporangiaceae bacterium]
MLLVVDLIAISPVALDLVSGSTSRWERLSFIGQTYGAILSVLALIGVVTTLWLQARETKLNREEARRAAIEDLLKMAMDDPDLDECWGPVPAGEDAKVRRQQMYVNMIISEWQMSFETKALGESRLRAISREMFEGAAGQRFWRAARDIRISTSETKSARRFHEILDGEYQRALASAATVPPSPGDAGQAAPPSLGRERGLRGTVQWVAVGVGAALAAVLWRLVRHRREALSRSVGQGRRRSAKRARWSLPGRS